MENLTDNVEKSFILNKQTIKTGKFLVLGDVSILGSAQEQEKPSEYLLCKGDTINIIYEMEGGIIISTDKFVSRLILKWDELERTQLTLRRCVGKYDKAIKGVWFGAILGIVFYFGGMLTTFFAIGYLLILPGFILARFISIFGIISLSPRELNWEGWFFNWTILFFTSLAYALFGFFMGLNEDVLRRKKANLVADSVDKL